jgi:lipopolysaccharide export system protein LptC
MEAVNQVQVLNSQGDLLETEHLIWNQETEKVYTEEFVKITTKDEVIFGKGLESNQDFTKYVIKKISGTIMLNNSDE